MPPKRYFEVVNQRLTMELDVTIDGMNDSVKKFEKMFNTQLREIDQKEFNQLTKEYTGNLNT